MHLFLCRVKQLRSQSGHGAFKGHCKCGNCVLLALLAKSASSPSNSASQPAFQPHKIGPSPCTHTHTPCSPVCIRPHVPHSLPPLCAEAPAAWGSCRAEQCPLPSAAACAQGARGTCVGPPAAQTQEAQGTACLIECDSQGAQSNDDYGSTSCQHAQAAELSDNTDAQTHLG